MKLIKNKIVDELIDLGISLEGKAIIYWTDLLLAIHSGRFSKFSTMKMYEYVAKKHKTKTTSVERLLRHGKDQMKDNITKKYGLKQNVTNEGIINLFILKIF